jgi:hypothetical protein
LELAANWQGLAAKDIFYSLFCPPPLSRESFGLPVCPLPNPDSMEFITANLFEFKYLGEFEALI